MRRRGHSKRAQAEIVSVGMVSSCPFCVAGRDDLRLCLPPVWRRGNGRSSHSRRRRCWHRRPCPATPLAAMLLTAVLNALRTVGLLFVGSLSPYLAVFSGIALWAKGFGIGFTLHGMQLAHGFGGLFLAFVMLALQNCLYLPSYAYLAVHGGRIQGYANTAVAGRKSIAVLPPISMVLSRLFWRQL